MGRSWYSLPRLTKPPVKPTTANWLGLRVNKHSSGCTVNNSSDYTGTHSTKCTAGQTVQQSIEYPRVLEISQASYKTPQQVTTTTVDERRPFHPKGTYVHILEYLST